jgi:glycosyltransferase involved in cell wall biosynthesis
LYWSFDTQSEHPPALVRACWHAVDLWNPSIFKPLRDVLDQIRPDAINTHNIDGFSAAVWQVAGSYAPVAHTLHDYHLVCPRATMRRRDGEICETACGFCRVYSQYHLFFQRYIQTLIAPSHAIAETHRQAGWTAQAIEIVPNGVDIDNVTLTKIPPAEPLRALFLARLEKEKGCETLLVALSRLKESVDVHFHLAGRGSYAELLSHFASEVSNTTWHGFVTGDEKRELYSRADVFLQLSECRENAPLGLIEAKRYGLYLLGANIGGIPELIGGPEDGRLIAPGDADTLCWMLEALASRKQEIRAGRAERLRTSARYGRRQMACEYLRVLRSLAPSAG